MRGSQNCRWHLSACVILVSLTGSGMASWHNPLSDFYGNYNDGFQNILRENCSTQYYDYLANQHAVTTHDPALNQFNTTHLNPIHYVINCMLSAAPELIKSKMATADILLGLLPSILAVIGVPACDNAIIAVVARKPLLAVLLGFGSPTVNAYHTSDYKEAIQGLSEHNFGHGMEFVDFPMAKLSINLAVYVLACASIANIAHLAWEMGGRIIFLLLPYAPYMVLLWVFLGLVVHLLATCAMYCLAHVVREGDPQLDGTHISQQQKRHGWRHSLSGPSKWLTREFGPGNSSKMIVHMAPDSLAFFAWAWFTSIYTIAHIIFGSALFASALFISVNDAMMVMGRLVASAVMCRLLVKVEIMLLKRRVKGHSRYDEVKPTQQLEVKVAQGK